MDILGYFGQMIFFVWLTGAVYWSLVSFVFAGWSKRQTLTFSLVGAVFQGPGFLGLVVFHFVMKDRESRKSFSLAPLPTQTSWDSPSQWSSPSDSSVFDSNTNSSFSLDNGFSSDVFATTKKKNWYFSMPGLAYTLTAVGLIAGFTASLFLVWFSVRSKNSDLLQINALSTGLDFWIFFSIMGVVATLILCGQKVARVGAVVLATVGALWLQLSLAGLLSRSTFINAVNTLFQIPGLVFSGNTENGFVDVYAFDLGSAWYLVFALSMSCLIGAWTLGFLAQKRSLATE